MAFSRFKDAVSDVKETVRRAFSDPACQSVAMGLPRPGLGLVPRLEARAQAAPYALEAVVGDEELAMEARLASEAVSFEARLSREEGWAQWASGAKVCEMPVFRSGGCSRLAVPPLPRKAECRRSELPPFRADVRALREVLPRPGVRTGSPRLEAPKVLQDLRRVLGLPIAIAGEDLQKLPRAIGMRFTLQLVKATGENIRNLDVLGVFLVPEKGVSSLRHDARTGRILLELNTEAVGCRRKRFILARKKDDRQYVSCFVED